MQLSWDSPSSDLCCVAGLPVRCFSARSRTRIHNSGNRIYACVDGCATYYKYLSARHIIRPAVVSLDLMIVDIKSLDFIYMHSFIFDHVINLTGINVAYLRGDCFSMTLFLIDS